MVMIIHTHLPKTKQKKKPGWAKAKAEHEAWLRKHGVHPEQLKAAKKTKQFEPLKVVEPYRRETPVIPSLGSMVGVATKKESMKYTGTLIKGIATMHKSNAVPVINEEQAKEISSMRR